MLLKYNPKKITGSFKGRINNREFSVQFVGYMDGTFVEAEYDEDHATKHMGGHGDATVVLNANAGAKVTVTLLQGSPSNDLLANLVPNAKRNFLPVGTLTFDDLNGTTAIKSSEAWIMKTAKIEFGKDVTGRQWVFDMGEAELFPGSSGDF